MIKCAGIFHFRSIRGLRYESHLGAASPAAEKMPTQAQNVFAERPNDYLHFGDEALSSTTSCVCDAVDSNSVGDKKHNLWIHVHRTLLLPKLCTELLHFVAVHRPTTMSSSWSSWLPDPNNDRRHKFVRRVDRVRCSGPVDDKSCANFVTASSSKAAKHVCSFCSLIKKVFVRSFHRIRSHLCSYQVAAATASVHHVRENQFTDRKKMFL